MKSTEKVISEQLPTEQSLNTGVKEVSNETEASKYDSNTSVGNAVASHSVQNPLTCQLEQDPYVVRAAKLSKMPEPLNDATYADTIVEATKGLIRYCSDRNEWLYYDNATGVWRSGNVIAMMVAKKISTQVRERAFAEYSVVELRVNRSGRNASPLLIAECKDKLVVYKSAIRRENDAAIRGSLKQAEGMLRIKQDAFDSNPGLLNTPTDTVELSTGSHSAHDPNNFCTKMTAVSCSPVGMVIWKKFVLDMCCGDSELADFLQIVMGMCLFGKVLTEGVIIFYGSGGNGKSTFINACGKVLGDYAGVLPSDIITQTTRNKLPAVATIKGKRLVIIAEARENDIFDMGMLKILASTGNISAEAKYKMPEDFEPTHTLVLMTNYIPKFTSHDDGTTQRMVVIPCSARFRNTSGEVKNYADYLYEACGGAILQWMVEGAKNYLASGGKLTLPKSVKDATESCLKQCNWLESFLDECCILDDSALVKAKVIYDAYLDFCKKHLLKPCSCVTFGKALVNYGFERKRVNTGVFYYGVSLL